MNNKQNLFSALIKDLIINLQMIFNILIVFLLFKS